MRPNRVLALTCAASALLFATSCGGDGRGPTGPDNGQTGPTAGGSGMQIDLVSGGNQTGQAGRPLGSPIVVRVADASGKAVAGASVVFTPMDGGSASPEQAQTDASGDAQTVWTLSTAPHQQLKVSGAANATLMVDAAAAPPPTVARVQVVPDSLVLDVGQTGDFNAVAYDSVGNVLTGRAVAWTSSDSTIVRVDTGGAVAARAAGTARITATVDGVSGSAGVRVRAPAVARVARVQLVPDSLVLDVGQTGDFNAVAYDSAGNALSGRAVTWSTSDSTIARVSGTGTVTGVAAGSARVTATVEGVAGSAAVRVRGTTAPPPAKVARVQVVPDSLVLNVRQTGDFTAVAYDSAGNVLTGRAVTWTTSDSTVAKVGPTGTVTAVSAGTARIAATVEGVSGSALVRVLPAKVARVQVLPDSVVLLEGERTSLIAVAYDSTGAVLTGRDVTWASSDTTVAKVSAQGVVTARLSGTAKITATVEGVTGSATVRVRGAPVARVYLRPDSLILEAGLTGSFTAIAFDSAGNVLTGRAVTWRSADSTIAKVAANGVITAVAVGRVMITATVEGVGYSAPVKVIPLGPVKVARVVVKPDSAVINVGGTVQFIAIAYDTAGNVLTGRPVRWFSYLPATAIVDASGVVTGVAEGQTRIQADVDSTASGSAIVRVRGIPAVAVARVAVLPDSQVVDPYKSGSVSAVAYDSAGNVLTGRTVSWSSSDTSMVAFVSGGTFSTHLSGTATVTANVEGVVGRGKVTVRTLSAPTITSISAQTLDQPGYTSNSPTPDVSGSGGEVHMRLIVALSRRVDALSLRVRAPDGFAVDCPYGLPASNDYTEWWCELYIPQGSAPGLWVVDRVTLDTTTYAYTDLVAQKTNGRAFDVFRKQGPDNGVPVVRQVYVQQDGGTGWVNGRYYIGLWLVDHVSGVHRASMTLRGPNGETATCPSAFAVYGDLALSGQWLCAFDLPQGSGTWRLESITVTDGVGLTATYSPTQLETQRGLIHVWYPEYEYQYDFKL